jgi:hypothetical protein
LPRKRQVDHNSSSTATIERPSTIQTFTPLCIEQSNYDHFGGNKNIAIEDNSEMLQPSMTYPAGDDYQVLPNVEKSYQPSSVQESSPPTTEQHPDENSKQQPYGFDSNYSFTEHTTSSFDDNEKTDVLLNTLVETKAKHSVSTVSSLSTPRFTGRAALAKLQQLGRQE